MTDRFSEIERDTKTAKEQAPAAVLDAGSKFDRWFDAQTRAALGKLIVCGYLGCLAAIFLYLAYRGVWCKESVFADLIETLKIGVIPVVTFVIGHYFGATQK